MTAEIRKIIEKYKRKVEVLEEKKEYADDKKFDKILDKIYDLNQTIEKLEKADYLISLDKNKYRIEIIPK